jgi:hypothetical protein
MGGWKDAGKPDAGWTDFSLAEGKTYSLSYLTWVADDWLAQAIQGLKTLSQFAVEGYCEPDRMVCFVSFRHCHTFWRRKTEAVLLCLKRRTVFL